ncbi:MAG: polysaccharide biosynthesis C-terminal domain-containing protein, partial [bacterium]
VYGFARAVVYFFGIFFITLVLGSREAGLYGAALRPVLFLAGALGLFSLSFLASYSASDGDSGRELFHRSIRASLAITVPIAFVLSATAWTIVPLVYWQPFTQAAPALAILAWWIPLLALTGPYTNVLVAGHRQGRLLRDNLYAAAFNIAGDLLVVPTGGIAGAAAITVISQLIVLALNHRSSVGFKLAPPILMAFARRL